MEIIDKSKILDLLKGLNLESLISEGFIAYSNRLTVIPPVGELLFENPPGDVHIKYGYIRNEKYYVIKLASGFPNNQDLGLTNSQGMMLLFEQKTGVPVSVLLDNGYLTDIRTAVAGQICAKVLSNRIDTIGIIGTGIQARLQLQYLRDITTCRDVLVWGRNVEHSKDFQSKMKEYGFNVLISSSVHDLSSKSNLIILATSSSEPLLFKEDLKPGTHITAIGADTGLKREIGPGVLNKASIVITDSLKQCIDRGEISHALKEGSIISKNIVELGKILDLSHPGRTKKEEITIADLTGVAVQDLKIASGIFDKYLSRKNEF